MNIKAQLIGCHTIVSKEVRRTLRIWKQTMLPAVITTILYFIIFGHVIGRRIGTMQQYPYIEFIAPGLIMMQLIMSAYASSASTVFSAKFGRHIEEILVSPMSPLFILLGFVLSGMFRGILVGVIVTIVAMVFAHLSIYSLPEIIFVVILASMMFSLAGVLNGIFAKKFDDINFVPTFILTPLTYLGGVFYSTQLLPDFWQKVSLINPIVYIIDTFRYGFLGIADSSILFACFIMLLITAGLFVVTYHLIKTRFGVAD